MESIIRRFSHVKGTLFLTGESGTGKTYLARKIYQRSDNFREKYINVNLATLQESLIESELFGHIKGAFTGAIRDHIGYLQMANKGTIFLDEVAELSLATQKKLLRVLEEKEFSPVGSNQVYKFEGRIIAATNKDLKLEMREGRFRTDLYYRLMVFNIHLNNISKDTGQVNELLEYYLDYFKDLYLKKDLIFEYNCKKFLLNYSWPGNIRELKNCMEYAVCMAGSEIKIDDLPDWLNKNEKQYTENTRYPLAYRDALDMFEKEYINYVLRYFDGRLNHTAKEVGMSKSTLISKMKKLGIDIWQIKGETCYQNSLGQFKLAG